MNILQLFARISLCALVVCTPFSYADKTSNADKAQFWLTRGDQSQLLSNQTKQLGKTYNPAYATLTLDAKTRYQEMEGFGYTLTGGSAMLLRNMEKSKRAALLKELFGSGKQDIAVSYLRISVGASDLDPTTFSYDDLPKGESDPDIKQFSIARDREFLIPVLKEILAINPNIKILASPWSPPAWMKNNNATKGGELLPKHYHSYAIYLAKYIQAMTQEGILVDALTIQNEPLHPGNNPSLLMYPWDQADFIKKHLGPIFDAEKITTKIIIYDHNANNSEYPIIVLNDPGAKKYIHGTAFHLYGGTVDEISDVHNAHPDKALYFTEQWVGAGSEFAGTFFWHIENLIIGASKNWCKTVLEWNLAADSHYLPHTDGGCDKCLGAISIDGNKVTRNPAYYIIAQASKFIPAGSVRIESSELEGIPSVAFLRPDGKAAIVLLNQGQTARRINLVSGNRKIAFEIPAASAVTAVF